MYLSSCMQRSSYNDKSTARLPMYPYTPNLLQSLCSWRHIPTYTGRSYYTMGTISLPFAWNPFSSLTTGVKTTASTLLSVEDFICASATSLFRSLSSWQKWLPPRIRSPYLIKTKGTTVMAKLRNPSKLLAHAIPSLLYIGSPAKGRTAPNILREQLVAAMALAAKISYASAK